MQQTRGFEIGDVIELGGRGLGEPARLGEILEVLGAPGREHYRILWDDDRETTFFPAPGAALHLRRAARSRERIAPREVAAEARRHPRR